MAHLRLDVTFIIFLSVVTSEGQPTSNPTCTSGDCSWESFTQNHKRVVNECSMTDFSPNAVEECPNYIGTTDSYVPNVQELSMDFFSISVEGDKTIMCANISFSLERGSGPSKVQAVRFALLPRRYPDAGNIYCQIWTLGSDLNDCSLSEGNCSYDPDMKRVFSNKCFCNITPNGGELEYSVDVLPKSSGTDHVFQIVTLPGCDNELVEKDRYCFTPAEDRWMPVHGRSEQLCLNDSATVGSIELTFDLASEQYGFKQYYVFLYDAISNTCNPEGIPDELIVNRISTPVWEETIDNQTFNMTTVRFEGLDLAKSYVAGIKVKEGPDKDHQYQTHTLCDTLIQLQQSPCHSNPCVDGRRCIVDCLNYSCELECEKEVNQNNEECQTSNEGAGHVNKKFYIYFVSAAVSLGFVVLFLSFVSLALRKMKRTSPNVTGGDAAGGDDSLVDPSEVESQDEGRSRTKAIWLVCNADWRLQDFADKLRGILQRRVKCKVSLHTAWSTADAEHPRWGTDEPCGDDRVCCIWDRNLPVFNAGFATSQLHSACQVMESLPESIRRRAFMLHFDFYPLNVRDSNTVKLPSGLSEFIEVLEGEIVRDDVKILETPYMVIKNFIQTDICERSKKVWATDTDRGAAAEKMLEDEEDDLLDYDSSDSLGSSIGDLSLDEEDADVDTLFQVNSSIT